MARKNKSGKKASPEALDPQAQLEHLAEVLGGSAHQVWLAGMGAVARAQAEGSRLFENLVKEGRVMERQARDATGAQAEQLRAAMDSRVTEARGRANAVWSRLEEGFDARLQDALSRMGVVTRAELAALSARIDALAVRPAPPPAKRPTRKTTVRKTPRKAVAKNAAAPRKAPVGKKAPARTSRKAPVRRA